MNDSFQWNKDIHFANTNLYALCKHSCTTILIKSPVTKPD